jgi:hypothetical protein
MPGTRPLPPLSDTAAGDENMVVDPCFTLVGTRGVPNTVVRWGRGCIKLVADDDGGCGGDVRLLAAAVPEPVNKTAGSSWRKAANRACSSRNWRCEGLKEKVRGEEKAEEEEVESEADRWAREGIVKVGKEVDGLTTGGIITAAGELAGTDRSFNRWRAPKQDES